MNDGVSRLRKRLKKQATPSLILVAVNFLLASGLLAHAPSIFSVVAVALFCLRGCSLPRVPFAPAPAAPAPTFASLPTYQQATPTMTGRSVVLPSPRRPVTQPYSNESPRSVGTEAPSQQAYVEQRLSPPLTAHAHVPENNPLGVIVESPIVEATQSPLFDSWAGRTFVGTSQMPGQPSKRIRLMFEQILDGGTNIAAKLSHLDGAKSRDYTGSIEGHEIVLHPAVRRMQHDQWFVFPDTSWDGGGAAYITLSVATEGKSLTGQASNGEAFEFTPDQHTPQAESGETFSLTDGSEPATWEIVSDRFNGQRWTFISSGGQSGRFEWKDGDTLCFSGRYRQSGRMLDLCFESNGKRKRFNALLMPKDLERIEVCVPKEDERRPRSMDMAHGRVLELVFVP